MFGAQLKTQLNELAAYTYTRIAGITPQNRNATKTTKPLLTSERNEKKDEDLLDALLL